MAKTLTQGYSTNSSFSEANAIKVYRPGTTRTGPGSPLEAWSAFKKRVHAQDLPGMRRIVYSLNRDSYEEILQNVGPQKFENLVTSFTNLEVISLYEDCAQYASEIVTDQGTVTFFLDFVQGEQGWEVYSF